MTRWIVVLPLATLLTLPAASALGQDLQSPRKLRILVTNDDGYQAPGLLALVDSLAPIADLTVVAPLEQQSGKSHGIKFRDPIKLFRAGGRAGVSWYAVDAPPATVVRVALFAVLDSVPDLVIAGINTGDNAGTNAWVSGTVAAAREAALHGLPGVAFSVCPTGPGSYAAAAGWARQVLERLQTEDRVRAPLLLNVNVPCGEPQGIRVAPMSLARGTQGYDQRVSPGGQGYLWATSSPPEDDPVVGTDLYWLHRMYITITPLKIDQTDSAQIAEMKRVFDQP
jgi:5'-nucleotidase